MPPAETDNPNLLEVIRLVKGLLHTFGPMKYTVLAMHLLLASQLTWSQLLETDIYLFDITPGAEYMELTNFVKVTDRTGYDNQPFFSPDSRFIFYASEQDSNQTDIYRFDIATGQSTRITATPESEYSPMLSPNGKVLTVVRQEADSTQRIWRMKPDGSQPKLLMPDVKDIGYYCWVNKKTLAIWTVSDTTLSIVKIKDQVLQPVDRPVGRSFHLSPSLTKINYVKKNPKGKKHLVIQYNFISGVRDTLVETFEDSEDICPNPSGEIMTSFQASVFSFLPGSDTEWQYWSSTAGHRVLRFYRMAISPDGKKLAVVTYQGNKP